MLPGVARRVEPDPQTWWETYGHRLAGPRTGPAEPPAPPPAPPARTAPIAVPRMPAPASVEESVLSCSPADVAGRGWRRLLAAVTRGRADPGPDGTELAGRERLARIRVPLDRPRRIAVTSLKGGVGKTTVTALLGLMLAEHRGDRVVAVDANPDAGTLADRLSGDA